MKSRSLSAVLALGLGLLGTSSCSKKPEVPPHPPISEIPHTGPMFPPPGGMPPAGMPPGAVPPGAVPPGTIPPGTLSPGAIPPGAPVGAPTEQRGRLVYQSSCTSCHNFDPSRPGAVGPDLKGSSLDLIRNKVLFGKYPDGYQPKRKTTMMPKFPHLAAEIDAIALFLK